MDIKKEFEYIDNHFSTLTKNELIEQLIDCGLKMDNKKYKEKNMSELKVLKDILDWWEIVEKEYQKEPPFVIKAKEMYNTVSDYNDILQNMITDYFIRSINNANKK